MTIKGIDVSSHQKAIDWVKVKNDGIKYVIIRAGYGQVHEDNYFKANIKGAIAAGLPVGIYWFSYALNKQQAIEEAEGCTNLIKGYKITLPIFFDFEGDSARYAAKNGVTLTKPLFNELVNNNNEPYINEDTAIDYMVNNTDRIRKDYTNTAVSYITRSPNVESDIYYWYVQDNGSTSGSGMATQDYGILVEFNI